MNPRNPNFISLESIHIATPCRADWNAMQGDDRARFCRSCAKNVYNLSAMTRDEAQRLILEKEGNLCVQLHRRADGTVITSDCPVGISPVKKPAKWLQAALAGAVAAIFAVFGAQSSWATKQRPQVTAGVPSVMAGGISMTIRGKIMPVMGSPAVLPAPTAKPSKTYAKRTSRKSSPKTRAGHRRHR